MLNLPLPFAQELQGTGATSPRVASRQPNLICFLRESPPVSTSAPASTPGLQGKARFSGIACNRSSIVVPPLLGLCLGVRCIRRSVCEFDGLRSWCVVSSSIDSGDSRR